MQGTTGFLTELIYGAGLRIYECYECYECYDVTSKGYCSGVEREHPVFIFSELTTTSLNIAEEGLIVVSWR